MKPAAIVRAGAAVAVVCTLLVAALMAPASAAPSTMVKGRVTVAGKPLASAEVEVYRIYRKNKHVDEVGPLVTSDVTDSKGRYSFTGLRTKKYAILVADHQARVVKDYIEVTPRRRETITRNFRVRPAGSMSGVLTTSDGRSPAGLQVSTDPISENGLGPSFDRLFPDYSATVAADGSWTISGIESGLAYTSVVVSDGEFAQSCFDFEHATLIGCKDDPEGQDHGRQRNLTLAKREHRVLPTVTVSKFASPETSVEGRALDPTGKPLKGIDVTFKSDEAWVTARTGRDGRFAMRGEFPPGRYLLKLDDWDRRWGHPYRYLTLAAGQPITGLDITMKSPATVKVAAKGGDGTATVAFRVVSRATGRPAGGTATVSYRRTSKVVRIVKGRGSATLKGLPRGTRSLRLTYAGSSTTTPLTTVVRVVVR